MDHAIETEPQRRRRGGRALFFGCGTTLVVLTVALFVYLGWANTLPKPEQDTRELPQPNGYDACFAAIADLNSVAEPDTALNALWNAEIPQLRRELAPRADELDEVRRAMRLPYLNPVQDSDVDFPQFTAYRHASRMFAGEARVAMAEGDHGKAIQRSLDAVDLGTKVGRGGLYLHCLVGFAIQSIGVKTAEQSIQGLTADEAHAAGVRVDRIMGEMPEAGDIFDNERRFSLNSARQVFAGRSSLSVSPGGTPNALEATRDRAVLFAYPKAWGYHRLDQYYSAVAAELRKPYPVQGAVPELPKSDPVLGMLGTDIEQAGFQFVRAQAMLRLLRAQLAVEEFRGRQGRLPDRLEELVPATIATLPEDPFSGKPLRFERKGNTYLLYSVGPDFKDDGGSSVPPQFSHNSVGDYVAGKLVQVRSRQVTRRGPVSP